MDNHIQKEIDNLVVELRNTGNQANDPVAKLMVATLLHQIQKVKDQIDALPQRIVERLCTTFIPKNKISAIPAIALVQPIVKAKQNLVPHTILDGSFFTYKIDSKRNLTYYPVLRTLLIPYNKTFLMSPTFFRTDDSFSVISSEKKGQVWLGLEITGEVESIENASFLIKGTNGVLPQRILTGSTMTELSFCTADRFDYIPMLEPFDSQQMNPDNLSMVSHWQDFLTNSENGRLIYITDPLRDRDAFKCKAFPKTFQQSLESADLDRLEDNTLWLLFDFGKDYDVPENIEIVPNVLPVVNINVNSVTLTQSAPIAKLDKDDSSYFLSVIETPLTQQKQGFNVNKDDVVIRDFDARSFNPADLAKEIRVLYNHFIEDYYAFVEYHGLKDGELVKSLRETVNKIGKSVLSVEELQNRFDQGVYAMRNIRLVGQTTPVKVSYTTTMGRLGNLPQSGSMMENKKDVALGKEVLIVVSACGGEDRATSDQMYELLRYYTLTSDRLFTKMDVDAFLRLQLLKEFGSHELKRISYKLSIEGAQGPHKLQRGLYIDISFKDNKNYQKALTTALDNKLRQKISDKSCISMPIIVSLSLEEQ